MGVTVSDMFKGVALESGMLVVEVVEGSEFKVGTTGGVTEEAARRLSRLRTAGLMDAF